jgi:hypothetical protein
MGIESLRGAAHSFPLLTRLSMARSTSKAINQQSAQLHKNDVLGAAAI